MKITPYMIGFTLGMYLQLIGIHWALVFTLFALAYILENKWPIIHPWILARMQEQQQ